MGSEESSFRDGSMLDLHDVDGSPIFFLRVPVR